MDIRKVVIIYISFIVSGLSAQANGGKVYLKGKVEGNVPEGAELIINVYSLHTRFGVNSLPIENKGRIENDGTFEMDISSLDSLFYIDIKFRASTIHKDMNSKGGVEELYLLAVGDSCRLRLNFERKSVWAIGQGADRINCQNQLHRISYIPSGAYANSSTRSIDEGMELKEMIKYHMVDLQLKILGTYKKQFSDEIYRRIYLDFVGQAKMRSVNYLLAIFSLNKDNRLAAKSRFLRIYNEEIGRLMKDTAGVANSAYFTDYIFELERTRLVFGQHVDTVKNAYSSSDLYKVFYDKYAGDLRQKLLLSLAYSTVLRQESNPSLIKRIGVDLQNKNYRLAFENWTSVGNSRLFDFDLPDVNGKRWKSTDFKGKLLVLDFWFNGCTGCAQMKEVLSPVVKKYKLDTNVVFIAISVDPTEKLWKAGLEKGIYTFSDHLNLYTDGLGSRHPLIKNYNFMAYPQLLFFDKSGKNIPLNVSQPVLLGSDGIDKLIRDHK